MDRVTFMGFQTHAREQYNAYIALVKIYPRFMDCLYPKYMLLCNCIELSLKAVLLRNKLYTPPELKRKFGHNIDKLAEEVNKLMSSPNFNKNEIEVINVLSLYHKNRLFTYPETGTKTLPVLIDVVNICERLVW